MQMVSWEAKCVLKCPLQWQGPAVCALFLFFPPLPFKKSVHATGFMHPCKNMSKSRLLIFSLTAVVIAISY